MLRIAEHFHDSDLGRQRQGNEDNYFVRAPLFVVADGMGGAQAGEVASELAVRQFQGGLPDERSPGQGLATLIQAANERIHQEARSDVERAGMGTTVTAAYVSEDTVHVAHVGDSRCYLLRDADLIRLTRDHSLVGELVAQGKLTEEQAEAHPQRSVITRALGAGPDVEVDLEAYPGRAGDLFLLCSDGLTSMVPEPALKAQLAADQPLERIGRALIAAANEAGGRDNITVILFRLEEIEARAGADVAGAATVESDRVEAGAVAVEAPRRTRTTERSAPEARAPAREPPSAANGAVAPGQRRRRRRGAGLVLIGLAVILPLLIAGWLASRAVYFIGTDPGDGRTVTIFRGLPYEGPFGVALYEPYYRSGTTLAGVPAERRAGFTDHQLRSRDDAEDLVIRLEKGLLE